MAGRVETMAETKTILVAGATGQQGGSVTRALVKRGHRVRGLTRNPEKIKELKALGLEGVRGDLTDKASLAPALRGVDAFFIVTTPFTPDFSVDVENEVLQGTTAIDAAKAARVPHVVLSSVASADGGTGIPHFESKAQIERHLNASGCGTRSRAPSRSWRCTRARGCSPSSGRGSSRSRCPRAPASRSSRSGTSGRSSRVRSRAP